MPTIKRKPYYVRQHGAGMFGVFERNRVNDQGEAWCEFSHLDETSAQAICDHLNGDDQPDAKPVLRKKPEGK